MFTCWHTLERWYLSMSKEEEKLLRSNMKCTNSNEGYGARYVASALLWEDCDDDLALVETV